MIFYLVLSLSKLPVVPFGGRETAAVAAAANTFLQKSEKASSFAEDFEKRERERV